ncbi:MAG: hypothetical protein SFZ24_07905 [Planctomycetota bacterium]|nr:hypothetical protein [Planctomycetota bacterium]
MKHARASRPLALLLAALALAVPGRAAQPPATHVALKSFPAEPGHKARAQRLRASGLTLIEAIRKAEPVGGGPALFANATAGKKDTDFAIQVECAADGSLKFVRVDKSGAKKPAEERHSKYQIDDPAAAAAAVKSFTLADAVKLAAQTKPGDPIQAQVYTASGKHLVEVRLVDADTLWVVDIDPAAGKLSE